MYNHASGAIFKVEQDDIFWLHREGKIWILHPENPQRALEMTKVKFDEGGAGHYWKSSLPDGFYREERKEQGGRSFSMLAIGIKDTARN